jgi:hypothetical protein
MLARFDFDGSVADPQALELTCRDLLEKLFLDLERKGKGIRELRIILERADAPREQLTLSASRPSRNMRSLMGLYRCAFDQLGISDFKSHPGAGPVDLLGMAIAWGEWRRAWTGLGHDGGGRGAGRMAPRAGTSVR